MAGALANSGPFESPCWAGFLSHNQSECQVDQLRAGSSCRGKENGGSREWTQQGQETNTRARIRFLRLQQMFVAAKLLNISLVIIICPSKFGFSDKCVRFVMSVEKWCKSPPVSSEPLTERFHQFFLLSNKRCWNAEMLPASLTIMLITLTTWLVTVVADCGVLFLLFFFFQTV